MGNPIIKKAPNKARAHMQPGILATPISWINAVTRIGDLSIPSLHLMFLSIPLFNSSLSLSSLVPYPFIPTRCHMLLPGDKGLMKTSFYARCIIY